MGVVIVRGVGDGDETTYLSQHLTKEECENPPDVNGIWRKGDVENSPYVCSFSRTKCNDGQACSGSSVSNTTPDEFNSIFLQTDSSGNRTCHRARGKYDLGDLTLKSKLAGTVFIRVINGKNLEAKYLGYDTYNTDTGVGCDEPPINFIIT